MTDYTVGYTNTNPTDGTFPTTTVTVSPGSPPFPSSPINDTLTPDGSYDTSSTSATVNIDGTLQLQSLFIGSAIEVDLGNFTTGSTLTGTGSITGSNDSGTSEAPVVLPSFVNYGTVNINGAINVAFTNANQIVVSAGNRLDIEGDLNRFGSGASTVTVAANGELDLNSETIARVSTLSAQGTVRVSAPTTLFSGTTALGGTVIVQGDASNAVGSGVSASRSTASGKGTYVATLDLTDATFSSAINNLTLLQDAQVNFGSGTTQVQSLSVTGSSSALVSRDVVSVLGTLSVIGNKSGAANQVVLSQAEFAGGGTVDFNVAASDGGANLRQNLVVDANTTLRNDGAMTIGAQGTVATTIGAASAASGSTFVNGSGGSVTIQAGASLSVAAIQSAGAITVAANTTFQQAVTNTGTIDITAGTLALASAVTGAGTIFVENGATLTVNAALNGTVGLRSGGTLSLSQPSSFTGTIQTPGIGARIDLAGVTATAATVSNGTIVVTTANGSFALNETGLINGTKLAITSDGTGGSLLNVSANTQSHPVAYRFFDSIRGTQFLTTSLSETQGLQANRPDLVYEGVGLAAANPSADPAAAPVYRFFDTKFGTHFYTSSSTERDDVIANRSDLVNEGVGFYEHATAQAGDVAVYRFFDTKFGTHFYTADANERATVIQTRPDLVAEGISFYAPTLT